MTHTTTFCPNCKHIVRTTQFHNHTYGSPLRICQHCGSQYIDRDFEELALRPYKKWSYVKLIIVAFTRALIISALVIVCVLLVLSQLLHLDIDNAPFDYVVYVIFAVCLIICMVYTFRSKKAYDHALYLEWLDSERRLKNVDYAIQLDQIGYDVPPQYLPIGYEKKTKPISYYYPSDDK